MTMTSSSIYLISAVALFAIGLLVLLREPHLFRKILAFNVMGNGLFLLLVAVAARNPGPTDPVPHAMVLTGIVVAVSATALGLALLRAYQRQTGRNTLPEGSSEP